jgi:uncharacterized protein DUF4150
MLKLPASTKLLGTCVGPADVCKTPSPAGPVPTPYVNIGMLSSCVLTVAKVLIGMKETVVLGSMIVPSKGDEPGTLLGVVSNMVMGPVKFQTYSSKVYAQGRPMVFHTAVTGHNGTNPNTVGSQTLASQPKVLISR